ncbi:hypothetical protein C9927_04195 [Pseudidiomarina aestuarii]|uniref:DUF2523 domain-containing protein n=2 Tax=Pseudidiomarina aestuarii TaxID=624146 RepID=A0A2T4D3M7_9GAMM|nr:hypothetical protein C9927_04195 [Pseudidiomarina aestuarii]
MPALIYSALAWMASSLLPLLLVGAGLTLVSFTAFQPLVQAFFDEAVSNLNGLPATALQLMLLGGFGEFLTIIGSAVLTRLAISTASTFFGIKFKST